MIQKIKNFFKELKIKFLLNSNGLNISYEYLNLSNDKDLLNYIKNKALELAKKENVNVYYISFKEINNGEIESPKSAVGKFISLSKDTNFYRLKFDNRINKMDLSVESHNIPRELVFPRIEISDKGDEFVLLHELGHYFLNKRGKKQSEDAADEYCVEFFDKHLPPFFKWIFQIDLDVRAKICRNYTTREAYNYLEDYKKFKKEYCDIKE